MNLWFLALGATAGLGAALILGALVPSRPRLAHVLDALDTPTASNTAEADRQMRWPNRVASLWGLPRPRTLSDLAVCEQRVDTHLAHQSAAALVGFAAPSVVAALTRVIGLNVSWAMPMATGVACSAAAIWHVEARLRERADQRRNELLSALSAVLDLTAISLAGGAGVESALTHAVDQGRGWAIEQLRRALTIARLTRQPPWQPLAELGAAFEVSQFGEFVAAMDAAAGEGAKIRATLASRATTMRSHQLTRLQARAAAASERLALPVIVLAFGFLVFVAYPAVTAIAGT